MSTALFSKKCEYAIQAVLFLSVRAGEGEVISVDIIAEELNIPKEFTSKILQSLTQNQLIYSKKGKSGGFRLGKPKSEITLMDIVVAIEGEEVFEGCMLGFPKCSSETPCHLHDKWSETKKDIRAMLNQLTIDTMKDVTLKKLKTL